ncbi:hypothetical protein [Blattabacterium cuenoti]|uniref:hypothetical protein n=1 Tax=Blattabacterium cuenoti TaxID=1653831 RepID=UPI001FCB441D|nr:hypothetical protein [Blattabacterium cuenoti]
MNNLKNKKFFSIVFLLCFMHNFFSNSFCLEKLSGISAVVGDDIILDSEVSNSKKNNNEGVPFCNTDVLNNNVFIQRLMLYHAKKDKSIDISDQELKYRIQDILSEMKKKYVNQEELLMQFQNEEFLKELNEKIKNKKYIEKFYDKITDDVEVSPREVKFFFHKKKNKIPHFPKKIYFSYLIFYPKLNEIKKKK